MSSERKTPSDDRKPMNHEVEREDPLGGAEQLLSRVIPSGVDRRTFLMRSALVGATAVLTGRSVSAEERTKRSTADAAAALGGPRCRQEAEGAGDDDSWTSSTR